MAIKTPAHSATSDVRKYSSRFQKGKRQQKVRKRTREIVLEMVYAENLMELAKTDSTAAWARYREMLIEASAVADTEIPKIVVNERTQKLYSRARRLRGHVRNWERTGEDKFYGELEKLLHRCRPYGACPSFIRVSTQILKKRPSK